MISLVATLVFAAIAAMALSDSAQAQSCDTPVVDGTTLTGTPCTDVLIAEPSVTTIIGGDGSDIIVAERSTTEIITGAGDDVIYAGFRSVTVDAGPGNDVFYGRLPEDPETNTSEDQVEPASAVETLDAAGTSEAQLAGTPGPDYEVGGIDDDTFFGDTGDDIAFGLRGNDDLHGGPGADQLFGGVGDDHLSGDDGEDLISGGFGYDWGYGGDHADFIRGDGSGDAELFGNLGIDTISIATGATPGFSRALPSSYPNFPGSNGERGAYIDLAAGFADNGAATDGGGNDVTIGGFENAIGTPFSDYIRGDAGINMLDGGGGADVIVAGDGNDELHGGADGDHLEGENGTDTVSGNAGSDYCTDDGVTFICERSPATGGPGVVMRDTTKISVGVMGRHTGTQTRPEIYVTGGSNNDNVTISYQIAASGSTPHTVTIVANAGTIDIDPSADGSCQSYAASWASCSTSARPDTVTFAGMGADDQVNVSPAAALPVLTTKTFLGNSGADDLYGDEAEDVLVGGDAGNWTDRLWGGASDDMLLNGDGRDELRGEDGNDLLISTSICSNDTIWGGAGYNNASWARYGASGVDARLTTLKVGKTGNPSCTGVNAGIPDNLSAIDALEGSNQNDVLVSGVEGDLLYGRTGADQFYGNGGNDKITANHGDEDPVIDCGSGTDSGTRDAIDANHVANCDGNMVWSEAIGG